MKNREISSSDILPSLKAQCPSCGARYEELCFVCPTDGTILIEEPPPGTTMFGCYQYLSLLGAGGCGVVFKAHHQILDIPVAIKVLLRNHSTLDVRRFQQEAKAACLLQHENIVYVREFGISENEHPYMIMEYLNGESLAAAIKRKGSLSFVEANDVFAGVFKGMSHAHRKGVVHRDLKPSNIVLAYDQEEFVPKVVDFGIAKIIESRFEGANLTRTGEVFGSPMYMSPEQALGKSVDPRTDIYSAGCVLFHALTGRPPIMADTAMEMLIRHINDQPPTLAEAAGGKPFPGQLEKVVAKAMAKNPADRQNNFTQFAAELSQAIYSKPILVLTSKAPGVVNTLNKALIVLLVASLAVGIGMAVTSQFGFQDADSKPKRAPQSVEHEDLTPLAEITPTGWTKSVVDEILKTPKREGYNFNFDANSTDECIKYLVAQARQKRAEIGEIDLSRTRISNASLEMLTAIPIRSLWINDTQLSGAGLHSVSKMETLEELHAFKLKNITDQDLTSLAKLQRLRYLDLGRDQIAKLDLSFLAQLKQLNALELKDTKVSDKVMPYLRNLHELHVLSLPRCNVTDEGIEQLRGLTTLHELDLTGCAITTESVRALSNNQLWKLYLDQTDIDDDALKLLHKQKSLVVLSIKKCPRLTVKGIAAIHNALPNCQLILI
jgi:serine/threonine protein kinase